MSANFIEINTTEKLDELFQNSNENPVMIFKHSTTCPISSGVYQMVSQVDADVYLVVVQKARNVSNYIAEKTGIRHESPQAFVIKDGEPVYHASHYDVDLNEIERFVSR
jgi:bacillithiol system protein YtxJ